MITYTFNQQSAIKSAFFAVTAAVTVTALLFITFFTAEPTISRAQASDTATFTISQTITDASSFLVDPTNVTMSQSINGVTGGNATGTTDFVVQSNNGAGYYVEIAFFNNGTPEAMLGNTTASESLRDYSGDVAGEPSYGFTASSAAQFAYTITSDTPTDTDPSFLNNTAACNTGSNQNGATVAQTCWKSPATSGFRVVERGGPATTGATSTLEFYVVVPNAAVPVPSAEVYTATATLSLFTL